MNTFIPFHSFIGLVFQSYFSLAEYHGTTKMAKVVCCETSKDECEYELRNMINIILYVI